MQGMGLHDLTLGMTPQHFSACKPSTAAHLQVKTAAYVCPDRVQDNAHRLVLAPDDAKAVPCLQVVEAQVAACNAAGWLRLCALAVQGSQQKSMLKPSCTAEAKTAPAQQERVSLQ